MANTIHDFGWMFITSFVWGIIFALPAFVCLAMVAGITKMLIDLCKGGVTLHQTVRFFFIVAVICFLGAVVVYFNPELSLHK